MSQPIDYYTGLLRGFIMAHNAPTIILHALEVVVSERRIENHGPLIGKAIPEGIPQADVWAIDPEEKAASKIEEDIAEEKKTFFWSKNEDNSLEKMLKDGLSTKDISVALGRTPASISTRIATKGLKRRKA